LFAWASGPGRPLEQQDKTFVLGQINSTFAKTAPQRQTNYWIQMLTTTPPNGAVIGFDASWQRPVITEEHAYRSAISALPSTEQFVYFGFPWATLFDYFLTKRPEAASLLREAEKMIKRLRQASDIVTVCQHVFLLQHQHLMRELGIRHVFWSHKPLGLSRFPDEDSVRIYPFPLYPVHYAAKRPAVAEDARPFLFSFAGAIDDPHYLNETRTTLVKVLGNDPRGKFIIRDEWYFKDAVYRRQMHGQKAVTSDRERQATSREYTDILRKSVFSLCPCGSGPNTIRLWESIGSGTIPVILSDTFSPPGPRSLWEDAAIFCAEQEATIAELPRRLEKIAAQPSLLAAKRDAMSQIWSRYGPDFFIHDVVELFGSARNDLPGLTRATGADSRLLNIADIVLITSEHEKCKAAAAIFCSGITSRALSHPSELHFLLQEYPKFIDAIRVALPLAPSSTRNALISIARGRFPELNLLLDRV
jgi:hypothetical protein